MVELGFKIVSKQIVGYTSASGYGIDYTTGLRLEYDKGKTTHPFKHHGPLALFKTLKDARMFLYSSATSSWQDTSIWLCLFEPSECKSLWYFDVHGIFRERINDFPHGTLFADSITLLVNLDSIVFD